jgi:DNA helicase-2/ATP-dependent DNA helicase PcrA
MTSENVIQLSDDIDKHVDVEIAACLNLAVPRSFFLFAGAGSGKTSSLITALKHIQNSASGILRIKGQKVAVITFTNAASDEIKRRSLFDPLIDVRTIHSFSWSLIDGLNHDIRRWLRVELTNDIAELHDEEARGRKGTKASATRLSSIESKTRRLKNLDGITRFTYSPTGDNRARDALNHSEVLKLTASFLNTKPAMQSILVGRYPIVLIDESQDTNKNLIDALFAVQGAQKASFALGLLGDMMQRIYNDGKEGLENSLPPDWATPTKRLNYRCPRRVLELINKIRSTTDRQQQEPVSTAVGGFVRLFILPSDTGDKAEGESAVCARMSQITGDKKWNEGRSVKTLTLEHRMAATRMGFLEMFTPLYEVDSWRTSFLEGTLPVSRFFTESVLPLLKAKRKNDRFALARIAKVKSPLLTPSALREAEDKQSQLRKVSAAIDALYSLWKDGADPTLLQILRNIAGSNLLEIPESLLVSASEALDKAEPETAEDEPEDRQTERAKAIESFLAAPFSQVEPFAEYFSGNAHFDTHQGVKGLEFDRVMVIMDDAEARGFLFKYDDLFGGKAAGGKSVESTRRLLYVTCSRAKKSLALIAYTTNPARIRDFVLKEKWFGPEEVITGVPV